MVSSKNVKVSSKRCLAISIENFTSSSPSEQIQGSTRLNKAQQGSTRLNKAQQGSTRLNKVVKRSEHFALDKSSVLFSQNVQYV